MRSIRRSTSWTPRWPLDSGAHQGPRICSCLAQVPASGESMSQGVSLPCYGEWPAHNARMDGIELDFAILAVRGVDGDNAVLIGVCPSGDYQGQHDCSAEANGYQWSFSGSIFDERGEGPGRVRLRIMSEGEVIAQPMETRGP